MSEYHKIQTMFKRDMDNRYKTLLVDQWSLPEFEYLANNTWVYTEKVDGTNIRVIFDGNISFGGKTDNAQIPAKLVSRLNERFLPQQPRFTESFGDSKVVLYGEGYGAKIQKGGGNYRQDQDFVLFDVRVGDLWLNRANVEDIASTFGLDVVPVIGKGTLYGAIALVKSEMKSTWGDFRSEGIVARPEVELNTRRGQRIITKIKCKDFEVPR